MLVRGIFSITFFLFCAATAFAEAVPKELEAVAKTVGSVKVSVDPRIELLTVVQRLSGYQNKGPFPLLTTFDFKYARDVDSYFSDFRTHRAVTLFEQMRQRGFMFDRPVITAMLCSGPPNMHLEMPRPGVSAGQAGAGSEQLEDFVAALADFAHTSHFADFYNAHRPLFRRVVEATAANLPGSGDASLLEHYYGMKQSGYNITLMMIGHPGGYGPRIGLPNGSFVVYSIIGPKAVADDEPVFGNKEQLRQVVWHEFSHSFINPITERQREVVFRHAAAFERIRKQMEAQAAGTWESAVEEHIIRAANVRMARREMGEKAAATLLEQEKKSGFIYGESLCRALMDYEQQRKRYRTIEDFYPVLMDAFD